MDADMEAAQVLGAGQSILPTNNVEYSGIDVASVRATADDLVEI